MLCNFHQWCYDQDNESLTHKCMHVFSSRSPSSSEFVFLAYSFFSLLIALLVFQDHNGSGKTSYDNSIGRGELLLQTNLVHSDRWWLIPNLAWPDPHYKSIYCEGLATPRLLSIQTKFSVGVLWLLVFKRIMSISRKVTPKSQEDMYHHVRASNSNIPLSIGHCGKNQLLVLYNYT